MKDQLKGCYFKDAAEVQVTLKNVLREVVHGGVQKCLELLLNARRSV